MATEYEKQIMTLISAAGESRSLAFEALQNVKKHNYDKAKELLKQSEQADTNAHNMQTELITKALNGKDIQITLLMVHAQDHYMCAQLARDLVSELIKIFEQRDKEKKQ